MQLFVIEIEMQMQISLINNLLSWHFQAMENEFLIKKLMEMNAEKRLIYVRVTRCIL